MGILMQKFLHLITSQKRRFLLIPGNKKSSDSLQNQSFRGAYGTRTRDPMRDRHVF